MESITCHVSILVCWHVCANDINCLASRDVYVAVFYMQMDLKVTHRPLRSRHHRLLKSSQDTLRVTRPTLKHRNPTTVLYVQSQAFNEKLSQQVRSTSVAGKLHDVMHTINISTQIDPYFQQQTVGLWFQFVLIWVVRMVPSSSRRQVQ